MLNMVKDLFAHPSDTKHAIGKSIKSVGPMARSIGSSSADFAKSIGSRSVTLAKDIGPKRALIGAAIVALAVGGGIVLVRYLRARDEERADDDSIEAGDQSSSRRKLSRAERRAVNAHNAAAH